MKVPGIIYSLLLAVGAWAVDYFSGSGAGSGFPWAPVLVAAVPVVLKFFTAMGGEEPPAAQTRGMETVEKRGYASKVLWG